jgi:hypothetical protein
VAVCVHLRARVRVCVRVTAVRAREALRQCLPNTLRNNSFMQCLKDDLTTKKWLTTLLYNIGASLLGSHFHITSQRNRTRSAGAGS